ncbi:MAG TPA: CARDB domain-containing protein, partial [Rhodothermales bacterium]|nr:CARDB domain-containing protein [Rhodothermales bacterium]
ADIRGGPSQPERGDVYEFDSELNNWASDPIRITLTPPPDLVVTDVQAPGGAVSGQPVELTWTVTNMGPGATRADVWSDRVFYSPTPVFDGATAVLLGAFQHRGALLNDASYTVTGKVRVPDGAAGEGFFLVHTNFAGTVYEHTFNQNNISAGTEPAVVTRSPYPDLVLANVSVAPSTATAGEQVAVSYEIANMGTDVADAWTDRIYVMESPEWDPDEAIPVGFISHRTALSPDDSRAHSTAITLPPQLAGSYFVFVWADAEDRLFEYPDDQGNVARSAAYSAAAYPLVDLRAEIVTSPASVTSGTKFDLVFRVANVGAARTISEQWTDEVYLSEDPELDPQHDILLAELVHRGALARLAEYEGRTEVTLPEGLDGDHFFIVRTDAGGMNADGDPSNNVGTAPVQIALSPAVDLRVTEIDAPTTVRAGEPVSISWTVRNDGPGSTRSSRWFDGVFLSEDDGVDRRDILLGTYERESALDGGESYQAGLDVSLPAYNSGRYFLLVQTDLRNDEYEHEAEFNNTASVRVDLTLAAPADLIVEGVTVPLFASPGEPVTVEWTVVNNGPNPARGRMREAVFISEDATWNPQDLLLGVAEIDIDLSPGEMSKTAMKVELSRSYTTDGFGNITGEMPGVAPGEYYAIVRTDIANNIRETNEDNNTSSSESTTRVDVPSLHLGVPEVFALSEGWSRLFRLGLEEGADIRFRLTSDAIESGNELYVARNRAPRAAGDFDWSAAQPFVANQELVVSSAQAGTYYVLVVARTSHQAPDSEQLTLQADALSFGITEVKPDRAGDRGETTVVLSGALFSPDSEVYLYRSGEDTVHANLVGFRESTELLARIPTQGLRLGMWDVVVEIPGGPSARLDGGFTIEPGLPPELVMHLLGPAAARVDSPVDLTLAAENHSNVNVERAAVMVRIPEELELIDVQDHGAPASEFWDRERNLFVEEDGLAWFLFFLADLRPGTTKSISLTVRASESGTYSIPVNYTEFSRTQLFWTLLHADFEALRLGEPGLLLGELEEEATGKTSEAKQENPCDPCEGLDEDAKIRCEYNARRRFIADHGEDYARDALGGGATGPRSPRPGLWPKLFCAPTGVDPCSDEEPPNMPCFCEGIGNCLPDFPPPLIPFLQAFDPNDMIGPSGFSAERWVSRVETLPYTIRFE